MFQRLWVRIPALYTGWTFFTSICCKILMFEKTKINEKRPGMAHLKNNNYSPMKIKINLQGCVWAYSIKSTNRRGRIQ